MITGLHSRLPSVGRATEKAKQSGLALRKESVGKVVVHLLNWERETSKVGILCKTGKIFRAGALLSICPSANANYMLRRLNSLRLGVRHLANELDGVWAGHFSLKLAKV